MKKVLLTDYFEITSTLQDDKINFELSDKSHAEAVPFLGRSSVNNGVVDYVSPREGKINEGGVLTIALDGSTGSTFYQHHNFSSGQNIWILTPREDKFSEFSPEVALFLVTSIKKAVKNYSYNLSLTKSRLGNVKIILPLTPNGNVDVKAIKQIMGKLRNIKLVKKISDERVVA